MLLRGEKNCYRNHESAANLVMTAAGATCRSLFARRGGGDGDLLSPYGFDDDIEAFNSVVRRLELNARRLPVSPTDG